MEEMIDEWKAVDLLLGLGEIYSDLGPVWTTEEQMEEGYSLTVEDLGLRLMEMNRIASRPFDKNLKQIYDNLNTTYLGYDKKKKLVPGGSEIGAAILNT